MDAVAQIHRRDGRRRCIVLPEADDPRVLAAAARIHAEQIAEIILLGRPAVLAPLARTHHIDLTPFTWLDPSDPRAPVQTPADDLANAATYAEQLYARRRHKGLSRAAARTAVQQPLVFAAMMVATGAADGGVAGAVHTTAEVVKTALQLIGMRDGVRTVSSFFLMQPAPADSSDRASSHSPALYADCALVVEPTAEQLAEIAIATATSAVELFDWSPKIALLSFSTANSARHPMVDKVIAAGAHIRAQRPDLSLLPEVQFDAALCPDILRHKAPALAAEGATPANIFIFPDLHAGNIGYKIAERIGGMRATGPLLQGLRCPFNDLSRGCSVDDIVQLVTLTAAQVRDNNR